MKVLDYIRENVTLDRIKEVEETLLRRIPSLDLEQYFDESLMESVYRSHKGSFKIDSSKFRGLAFLGFILHILFGEPKFNPDEVMSNRVQQTFRKVLKKRFGKNSYFLRYSVKYLDLKTGEKFQNTHWINIEPYAYPILGGEIFFYCTLRALIEISKNALTDKQYDYLPVYNWKEGIVHYLVYEVVGRREDV